MSQNLPERMEAPNPMPSQEELLKLLTKGTRIRIGREWNDDKPLPLGELASDFEIGEPIDFKNEEGKLLMWPEHGQVIRLESLTHGAWSKQRERDTYPAQPDSKLLLAYYVSSSEQTEPAGRLWIEVLAQKA